MTAGRILSAITRAILYVFIFLIPIFFLPFTAEWLEFNKQYLLYAIVSISLFIWIIKSIMEQKIVIKRTFFDIPLILLTLALLAASIFSKDRITSFFGLYGNMSWGFIPFLFYLLFFFLITQNMENKGHIRKLLGFLVAGASLAALYYWGKIFGLFNFPGIFPSWNTVHSFNSRFGIALLPPLLIGLNFLAKKEDQNVRFSRLRTGFWACAALLFIITIASLGFKNLIIAAAIALGLFLFFSFTYSSSVRPVIIFLGFAIWTFFILSAIFGVPSLITNTTPTEASLTHTVSWQVVWSALKEGVGRFFIGSGPASFVYDFSAYRPLSFNENFLWSMRFNTPSSEIAHQAAGTGLFGLSLWIILGFFILKESHFGISIKRKIFSPFFTNTGNVLIFTFILLFFIPFGTIEWIYFFGLLACLSLLKNFYSHRSLREYVLVFNSPQKSLASLFCAITIIASLAISLFYLGRFYAADYLYAQGIKELAMNKSNEAMASFSQTLRLNNNRYEYYLGAAQAALKGALLEASASKPNKVKIGQLISMAVKEARAAAQLNSRSASTWGTLGGIYAQARSLSPDAAKWAIDAYSRALALEPNNPAFFLSRGLIYRDDKKNIEAKKDFEKALALKSNYLPARLLLAQIAEKDKNIDQAVKHMEAAIRITPNDLDVAFNLARLYFNRKQGEDLKKSENILKTIVSRNANYANAYFILGGIYEQKKDNVSALAAYQKALEFNKDNEEIKKKITALKDGK